MAASVAIERLRRSFWFLPVLAILLGGLLGFAAPWGDELTDGTLGPFSASDGESARGLLQTIATVTISVAGIAFSVTVVALQLASQQLGPRVLQTFQANRLSQATLAVFLGLFVYALFALGRLDEALASEDVQAPNLVLTVAVGGATSAFILFVAFIQNTVSSLQASTLIRRMAADAARVMDRPYPDGIGTAPRDPSATEKSLRSKAKTMEGAPVRAPRAGYLLAVDGEELISILSGTDAFAVQVETIGEFLTEGRLLARIYAREGADEIARGAAEAISIGEERSLIQDVAFPIRQLADVALRALSPSLNDPTTAENAIGSLAQSLIAFASREPVPSARLDDQGTPRLLASAPDLDDLVRLGFEQIAIHAADEPVVRRRCVRVLGEVRRIAAENGHPTAEIDRWAEVFERS